VRRQLDLVATVGAYTADERLAIAIPPEAQERVNALLVSFANEPSDRWVVIHAGATAASRRYPPEHFAAVGRRLVDELGCRLFFTGTAAEEELVESVRAAMRVPSHSLVGRLSLSELAALLERVPLLVSNNTGTVHVAAAMGTPVIDLYALTNPQHTPWQVPHRVLSHDVPCKFCYKSTCPEGHHDCLRLILPDEVVRAAAELLACRLLPDRQAVEKGGTDLVHARS
jgi:ADP-heptose:LPS heptosyltransferase